ncbi:monosaccharide ABC transporter membrane protein, CUT2 family [Lachnospiraceae bacterium KH1T2]|nr:monosaccharide ABC transporter membrane protein, CUT2 family [Lachnospiraceae bacterium KH1T2]
MNKKGFSLKGLTKKRLFMPIACLIVVLLINLVKTPDFFNISINNGVLYGYIIDVINRGSELAILAIGMTLVASSSGGTDISVGAIAAVAAAVITNILSGGTDSVNEFHAPLLLAILAGLLVAVLCGMWNGFLVASLKIQPMVATLILYTAGRGIAQLITRGQITYIRVDAYKVIGSQFGKNPVPAPIYVAVLMIVIATLFLKYTAFGLYVQTVGINAKAARLVGLNPVKIQFLCYMICGLMAGIAGVIYSSRIYSCDANNIGLNVEMDAILAVALGGNSLAGGKFSLPGSLIGAYTIQALTTSLYAMGVSSDQLPVYKAIVVVVIVSLQSPELYKMLKHRKANSEKKNLIKEAVQS